MRLIDSHCHLDVAAFALDRSHVCQAAHKAGIVAFIVPAICTKDWHHLQQLGQQNPACYPAYGIHPWFIADHSTQDLTQLKSQAQQAVAVGECGLDFYQNSEKNQQLEFFQAQLAIAADWGKPVIVHARHAVDAVIAQLKKYPITGVIHSFAGSVQQANQLIKLGFYLGVGGAITYPRANKLRTMVKQLPLEALLLETDAPWQPVYGQSQRNEPINLLAVLNTLAELRQQSAHDIAAASYQHTCSLFGIQP
jgi:TatD DNase family protein